VSDDVKGLLQTIAAQRQITESALVRQLVEAMLQVATVPNLANTAAPTRVVRDARLYVRLAPEDCVLLSDRAKARGMPSATYVSVLVRSHLPPNRRVAARERLGRTGERLTTSRRLLAG
jgi:predicted DNA binding CopG/RHH family protein